MSKGLACQGLPFAGLEALLGENFQSGECPLDRWSHHTQAEDQDY